MTMMTNEEIEAMEALTTAVEKYTEFVQTVAMGLKQCMDAVEPLIAKAKAKMEEAEKAQSKGTAMGAKIRDKMSQ